MKDLVFPYEKRKATMHIIERQGKFLIINDLLGGTAIFEGESIEDCEDWYFKKNLQGIPKINC